MKEKCDFSGTLYETIRFKLGRIIALVGAVFVLAGGTHQKCQRLRGDARGRRFVRPHVFLPVGRGLRATDWPTVNKKSPERSVLRAFICR